MSEPPGDDNSNEDGDGADEIPDSVKENLLDHPYRRDIVDLLDDRPGMNKNQICEEIGMDGHLLDHHLDQLEHQGRLVVTRESAQGKEVLCFLVQDEELWEDENTRILFGRRRKRAVALFLADNPGASSREIAEALRLSPDTVRYHLRTLMAHDLVERYPSGQTNLYEPADALREWAREVGEGFDRPWER